MWLQASPSGSPLVSLLPLIAIFLVFYFLLILPNQRRQKKLQEMIRNLKNGDRVVTNSGMHGTVVGLRDDYIVLRVPPDSLKIEVQRASVAELERSPEESG
jgi:preprotein translocase subunit YajC